MRKLLLYTAVPLIAACLSLKGAQATEIGGTVPKATGAGQSVYSGSTAPFYWQPVTLPYGMNGTGQMAVGGTVDATTRLSVNPQGASENGLTVKMPSGATGNAFQVKNSTGTPLLLADAVGNLTVSGPKLTVNDTYSTGDGYSVYQNGSIALRLLNNTGAFADSRNSMFLQLGGQPSNVLFTSRGGVAYTAFGICTTGMTIGGYGYSTLPVPTAQLLVSNAVSGTVVSTLQAASGQTADLLDLNDSTNAVKAKVDSNFKATFAGLSTTGSAVSTLAGGLSNSGYSLTNALSAPTGLAVTPVGTAGTTTYRYYVVAVSGTGSTTVSNEAIVTTANATLTSTNYNALSWTVTPGAETYSLYRTLSGGASGSEGLIVAGLTAATYADYIAAPGATYPTVNTTGYHNAASYQVGGVAGVTTTLADGSAVTKGIVTSAPTTTSANTILAGPASGAASPPTFRALVPLDLPAALVGTGLTSTAGVLSVSVPVPFPAGSPDGQTLSFNSIAGNTRLRLNPNHLINTAGQTAFGGAIDTNTRLSVSPQSASEAGVVVTIPSGGSADALTVQSSTGSVIASISSTGRFTNNLGLRTVTAADTTTSADTVLFCNGTFTESINSGNSKGFSLTIINIGTGTITISGGPFNPINGSTSPIVLSTQYQSRTIINAGNSTVANYVITSTSL